MFRNLLFCFVLVYGSGFIQKPAVPLRGTACSHLPCVLWIYPYWFSPKICACCCLPKNKDSAGNTQRVKSCVLKGKQLLQKVQGPQWAPVQVSQSSRSICWVQIVKERVTGELDKIPTDCWMALQTPLGAKSLSWSKWGTCTLQRHNHPQEWRWGFCFLLSSSQGWMSFWNGCCHQAGVAGLRTGRTGGTQWPLLERRSLGMISWSLLASALMTPSLCCLVKQKALPGGSAPIPFQIMKEECLPLISQLAAKFAATSSLCFPLDT